MSKSGFQYDTIGPNRGPDGDAVPELVAVPEKASQDFLAGALLVDDGVGFLRECFRFVTSVTVTAGGSGFTSTPTVVFASTAAVVAVSMGNQGTNYLVAPAITFTGGGGTGAAATAVIGGGKVQLIILTASGTGYTSAPTVVITAATNPDSTTGSGATATATISGLSATGVTATARINGSVASIALGAGGTSYTSTPQVYLSAPQITGGVQATAIAVLTSTAVSSYVVVNPGTGYTSAPTVTVVGGGGSGATGTAAISGAVYDITITASGAGYITPPNVTFSGGAGSGATATASLNPTRVTHVAGEDGHNTVSDGDSSVLCFQIYGAKQEFTGTLKTTNFARNTSRFATAGVIRDPLTKKHALDLTNTGAQVTLQDVAASLVSWDDGDSYPVVNFHFRSSVLALN